MPSLSSADSFCREGISDSDALELGVAQPQHGLQEVLEAIDVALVREDELEDIIGPGGQQFHGRTFLLLLL